MRGLGDADIGGPKVLVVHDGLGPGRHPVTMTREGGGAGGREANIISIHIFFVVSDIFWMFSRQEWARNSGHIVRSALTLFWNLDKFNDCGIVSNSMFMF